MKHSKEWEDKLNNAISEVTEELMALSPEEFNEKINKCRDGRIANVLFYAWNPELFENLPNDSKHL